MMAVSFDALYFRRFYRESRSRVYGSQQLDHLARGVTGFIQWFGGSIERVLDVGAGTGLWTAWFRRNMPRVNVLSVDVSEYACATFGHELRDIASWRSRERFDLIICQGVLPYLADADCVRAVSNMAHMCRGFLYVEAITKRDLREVCDRSRTDLRVAARPARFYKRALGRWFEPVGCGIYHVLRGDKVFYDLERA
jgi:2-polyprenyl-3-methyl-5-hydroxy-6-metoxy-1,4-benzoquinol methylase